MQPPAATATPGTRDLPQDPDERARALATVKDEADLCVGVLSMMFGQIWTKEPLTEIEKEGIHGPMAAVIYKHGGSIPVEWQLMFALGAVAAPRYMKHKQAEREKLDKDRTTYPKAS